jgi:hypothetical protein
MVSRRNPTKAQCLRGRGSHSFGQTLGGGNDQTTTVGGQEGGGSLITCCSFPAFP